MTERNLLTRLRRATRPERGLDAEIAPSAGLKPLTPGQREGRLIMPRAFAVRRGSVGWDIDVLVDNEGNVAKLPRYTASVDAALTLIPDGMMWFLGHLDPSDMRFAATISERGPVGSKTWRGFSTTPALAICIAALEARNAR